MESNALLARPLRHQLRWNTAFTVVLATVIAAMINYLGFRYYWRKDFSQSGYYRLSEKTIHLLESLPQPVHVFVCLATSNLRSEIDNLLREYQYRGKDKLVVEHVDPALDLDRAEALAKKYNFDLRENVIIFEYKGKTKFVDEAELVEYDVTGGFLGQAPRIKAFKGEQQFTSAIQSLVEGKPAKVYFLTGHGERAINFTDAGGYGEIELRLRRENMETEVLNLAVTGSVPKDADLLIIAGPKVPLKPSEVEAIRSYLEANGKLIVLEGAREVSGLEPLLEKYGIQFHNDIVVARGRIVGLKGEVLVSVATGNSFGDHPAVRSLSGYNLQMPNARSLAASSSPNASKTTWLVRAPEAFWGETDSEEKNPQFDSGKDIAGPLTLAMVYDGGRLPGQNVRVAGARIAAIGSSSFLANQNLDGVAVDFFINLVNWMTQRELALGITPKTPQEFRLSLTPQQKLLVASLALTVFPGIALLAGISMWVSRRQ
ncbi:GldG family protein [Candidatus Methylacidithermus pantelleriae]|uniref:ABC-type uncharacterized transport system involved in gliding motility auxiliary subunit n=1 Tax=Candidatus Methylacidithermus pantelleriae TaxID=2744239 RepID=A0A8J2BT33_9BACT|nr:GldG family protein [Candidatus Methylacidithermus pantelleriae]CAF0705331.1 ABC-type uncharacterized transport system involved in gliding motility auxiliary subunit [Candidatus Methylacidithermus pantelleriae]